MANTSANVNAGKPNASGACYVAATTATLPTSTSAALTSFTSLGYISEAGLVNMNPRTFQEIKAWGGDVVLTSKTEQKDEFKFTLIESTNIEVLKLIYGDAKVTETGSTTPKEIKVEVTSDETPAKEFVFDMVLSNGKAKRICIPSAKVTSVADINYKDTDAIGYEVTISCAPDASGRTHYEYIK